MIQPPSSRMSRSVFFILMGLTTPVLVLGGWNREEYRQGCKPALDCTEENVCYCSDRFEGWENGGLTARGSNVGAACYKGIGNDCQCEDCGVWGIFEDAQCQESRCDDEVGFDQSGVCYHVDPKTKIRWKRPRDWKFNCYKKRMACTPELCEYGRHLTGCKRVSPGSCTDCPALVEGSFWARRGSCEQTKCTSAGAGKFVLKACTSTADAVIADCSTHPGNPKYIVPRQDGRATYYCPNGGLVLPLPDNSAPTEDYSNFVCIDGYYLSGASCLQCLPGYACKHGRKFTCPDHYYTSTFAKSSCIRCSTPGECHRVSEWETPIRCKQGSTANVGCVACGGCSWDPRQGLSCVTEPYEMDGLPSICEPTNIESEIAVCA